MASYDLKPCYVVLSQLTLTQSHANHADAEEASSKRGRSRSKPKQCSQCLYKAPSLVALERHGSRKHPNNLKSLQCQICSKSFQFALSYRRHVQRAHSDSKRHVCPRCGKRYMYSIELSQHMSVHLDTDEAKIFKCPYKESASCNAAFRLKLELDRHIKLKHLTTQIFYCSICPYQGTSRQYLKNHLKKYGGSNPAHLQYKSPAERNQLYIGRRRKAKYMFSCTHDQCTEKYQAPEYYEKHFHRSHPNTTTYPFKCTYCNGPFKTWPELNHHISTEHIVARSYPCSICAGDGGEGGFNGETPESLKSHLEEGEEHQEESQRPEIEWKLAELEFELRRSKLYIFFCDECQLQFKSPTGLRTHSLSVHPHLCPFKCTLCENGYKTYGELNRHVARHTGEKVYECEHCRAITHSIAELKAHLTDKHTDKIVECEICAKKLESIGRYRAHMKKIHDTTREKATFCCPFCDKVLRSRFTLYRHIDVFHIKESVYSCQHCGKTYGLAISLTRHLQNKHFNEENLEPLQLNFKCQECDKSFRWESQLNKHLLIHTDAKPHPCQYCTLSFKSTDQLKCHIKQQHGKTKLVVRCPKCPKIFTQAGSMKRHMEVKHGTKSNKEKGTMLYSCEICGRKFPYKCTWKNHVAKMH